METRGHRVQMMNAIGDALGIPPGGWSHGQSRLFERGEIRLYWLLHRLSGGSASNLAAKNLARAIQFVSAEVMLTLVTAARENSQSIAANSSAPVNTFGQGGLDFLGAEMHTLGLPRSVTAQWATRARFQNLESGNFVQPANIPGKDQVLAYAAQINASFERRFKGHLRACLGLQATPAVENASRAALLVWKAYAFLAPGGGEYDAVRSIGSQIGQSFGIRTCLQYLQKSVDPMLSLDLICTHQLLNQSEWVRIAKARAAEALFLERVLSTTRDLMVPAF